ncbi:MAG: radical SAM family heme chaperone HemW [Gemmatimonadaceae bacterium]
MTAAAGAPPRHVYVHVPFCARRCSYCDFSIAVRRDTPVDEFVGAAGAELDLRFPGSSRDEWSIETLYLGGGTPSRLGDAGVASLLAAFRERIRLEPNAEVTLEVNPDDVNRAAALAWRDAGINRVSLGAQSFDDRALAWMHRLHASDQTIRAVDAIRAAGIDNISLDLIFALPAALGRRWEDDLRRAVALEPSHVSLYGLTVHERTPLARWRERGELEEAPDESYAAEFIVAHEMLTGAGFEHYEVSSYARPGMRSRHNTSYWTGAPWAGIGPSAHEFDGVRRRWNVAPYAQWLRLVQRGCDPKEDEETLSASNTAAERVYLGLRTSAGLEVGETEAERARQWVEAGWAELDRTCLRLTPEGWLRLDALAAALT